MNSNPNPADEVIDATGAYRQWDELFAFSLKMALATESGTDSEKRQAWKRLMRSHARSLAERDAMWVRLVRRLESASHGG
ncbi:MAG: hypothetical protein AB1486_32140 [Planctomycetota bacterium]